MYFAIYVIIQRCTFLRIIIMSEITIFDVRFMITCTITIFVCAYECAGAGDTAHGNAGYNNNNSCLCYLQQPPRAPATLVCTAAAVWATRRRTPASAHRDTSASAVNTVSWLWHPCTPGVAAADYVNTSTSPSPAHPIHKFFF